MNDPRIAEAQKLKGVMTLAEVAAHFGVSRTTVCRWVYPGYLESSRRASLEAKKRRTGICERCGGETRYNGGKENGPSKVCDKCSHTFTHCINGHLYTPETDLRGQAGYKRGRGNSCRICRNLHMNEYLEKKRRAAGVPEKGPYRKPVTDALIAALESEGAPK